LIGLDGQTVPDWVGEALAREGIDLAVKDCRTREDLAEVAGDADIVWAFGGHHVLTAENLPLAPRCGGIIRTGSGTDNIPVEEATRRGIIVANTPDALTDAVADHTIGLLLDVVRQITAQDRAVRGGRWDRMLHAPRWHVQGQTLGLIGFGRIPRLVARKLQGFALTYLAYDPFVSAEDMAAQGVQAAPLDDLLARSDFVLVHCPLTRETHHLLGERELRLMKSAAILVNAARGAVIDELALLRALTEGWIAAAGLDVLEQEPPDWSNPLLGLDNVVITPHMAALSDDYLPNCWRLSVETAIALAQRRWPQSYVNHNVQPRWEMH
jgi:D-3-phosphoglycerate dehydrogenase